jgi:putative glutamine amidotransferase
MRAVAITQRVTVVPSYGERRDCLDQAWIRFLGTCGLLPVPLPNDVAAALALCERAQVSGLVLTGGNDLVAVGGDAPERDETENAAIDWMEQHSLPVLAVCRGMQLVQHRAGVPIARVEGHVAPHQTIRIEGAPREVNSYHGFAAHETRPPLEVWAVADDGIVKAVRDPARRTTGIMWHPERLEPFQVEDVALFRRVFGVA